MPCGFEEEMNPTEDVGANIAKSIGLEAFSKLIPLKYFSDEVLINLDYNSLRVLYQITANWRLRRRVVKVVLKKNLGFDGIFNVLINLRNSRCKLYKSLLNPLALAVRNVENILHVDKLVSGKNVDAEKSLVMRANKILSYRDWQEICEEALDGHLLSKTARNIVLTRRPVRWHDPAKQGRRRV
jgi:hypothetical protein